MRTLWKSLDQCRDVSFPRLWCIGKATSHKLCCVTFLISEPDFAAPNDFGSFLLYLVLAHNCDFSELYSRYYLSHYLI